MLVVKVVLLEDPNTEVLDHGVSSVKNTCVHSAIIASELELGVDNTAENEYLFVY